MGTASVAVAAAILLGAALPDAAAAQDSLPPAPVGAAPTTGAPPADTGTPCRGCRPKRPLRAVLEGLAINVAVNRYDAWIQNAYNPWEGHWARVGLRSWSANLRGGWDWDTDAFPTNMFVHPIHGSEYFLAGRSNGLNFWESVPLPFLGSAEWEYFGETARPSLNDFYNTAFGGVVLGEMSHRLVALIRDDRARGTGRVLREVAAAPLDPVGFLTRIFNGDVSRVQANPADRESGALTLELRGGGRLAEDSGTIHKRVLASTLVAELRYGDPFAKPYARPFDVFDARLMIGAGGHSVNELTVAGQLFAHEFTYPSADVRTIFTVSQKIEYVLNPAYKYGGQSLDVGLLAGFTIGRGVVVRTNGYLEGIMLGAVDAPGAGIDSTLRTYDFGPGAGFGVGASLRVNDFPVLTARWRWSIVHSVSGSPADHYTQLPSVEIGIPVTSRLGVGAYAGWYRRHSDYAGRPGEAVTYPDFRASLVWQTRHRPRAADR